MHKKGWSKTAEVSVFTEAELQKRYGPEFWIYPGTTSRCFAENGEKVCGWKGVRGVGEQAGEWEDYVRSETRRMGRKFDEHDREKKA